MGVCFDATGPYLKLSSLKLLLFLVVSHRVLSWVPFGPLLFSDSITFNVAQGIGSLLQLYNQHYI